MTAPGNHRTAQSVLTSLNEVASRPDRWAASDRG